MAEWFIAPDSKSGVPRGTEGSNPFPPSKPNGFNKPRPQNGLIPQKGSVYSGDGACWFIGVRCFRLVRSAGRMEVAVIIAIIGVIGTWIIAANNLFGLKDRAVGYLRQKLAVETMEEEIYKRHVESDRELLSEIRKMIPSDYPISMLRDYDFGGPYSDELPKLLRQFVRECEKPEFEFHDTELEQIRKELEDAARRFTRISGKRGFYIDNDTVRIPKEWHHERPDKWHEARNNLNSAADDIIESYDELIRTGRKKLGAK